ncbi:MAG TPA: AMP-binding protein, partial [Acidimicrobiales bacterium]
MTLSYADAATQVTMPGTGYETVESTIGGIDYTVFKNAPPNLRTIFAAAKGYGDRVFLVYEDERLTFAEVMDRADAFGAALVERYGVTRGDRVAIGMRNYPEWVIAFAGIVSVGAVAVSLNAWWTADELDYALEDSGAKVLVADPERIERTRAAAKAHGVATVGVRLGADGPGEGVDPWDEVVVPGTPLPDVTVDPEDDA